MFRADRRDVTRAAIRSRCSLCTRYFNPAETQSLICSDCTRAEPKPLQDNEGPDAYKSPIEAPEIAVARTARIAAELEARRCRLACILLHSFLSQIAGARGKGRLRLLPKDQSRLAEHALENFEQNFPEIAESMSLFGILESR